VLPRPITAIFLDTSTSLERQHFLLGLPDALKTKHVLLMPPNSESDIDIFLNLLEENFSSLSRYCNIFSMRCVSGMG